VAAGEAFSVGVRLFNASEHPWTADGAARVQLAYHWRTPEGEMVEYEGMRTPIDLPVPPGGAVVAAQRVRAPEEPGRYVLELDLVFEQVAWFSDRNGGNVHRIEIEVTAGEETEPEGAAEPGDFGPTG
jgi:hypothetical protein